MARPVSKYPTPLELDILKIVWPHGGRTARQVRETLASTRPLAPTSVVTVMNIMVDKEYLTRAKEGASYVYRPLVTQADVRGGMLGDMIDRVYDGSIASVMQGLLNTDQIDAEELDELRQLIERKSRERSQ